jgi:hypothetical protein
MRIECALVLAVAMAAATMTACPQDPCGDLACGEHGSCDAATGACVCDDGYSGAACEVQDALEIAGTYVDNWGMDHEVTQTTWTTMGSSFAIAQYSNAEDWLVAHNAASNAYNPDLWSRFDWTVASDTLYYCQTAFDAADEAAALATAPADRADLETGCGGYGWSRLDAPLEIRGRYVDDWAYVHEVTQLTWTTPGTPSDTVFHIAQFDNTADYLVAQNDAQNAYSPGLWSRFDWTRDGASLLYYCQIVFDATTEAAALAVVTADREDLTTGCGGYGWSRLTPQ